MNKEEKEAINRIYDVTHWEDGEHASYIDIDNRCSEEDLENCEGFCKAIDIVLNLIQKREKIIDNAIKEVEKIRCYFSEDIQVEFIRVLEILKDKNVKDW